MGYRSYLNSKAKCPLFVKVVWAGEKWKIAGVQCACISEHFGLPASTVIRAPGKRGLLMLKKMYCDSTRGYKTCPYYQAYIKSRAED